MCIRLHITPALERRTDGRTDRWNWQNTIGLCMLRTLMRNKKTVTEFLTNVGENKQHTTRAQENMDIFICTINCEMEVDVGKWSNVGGRENVIHTKYMVWYDMV